MRYTIVKHDSLEILVDHINALIADGWSLEGGVAAIAVPDEIRSGDMVRVRSERHYAQAMSHASQPPARQRLLSDCPYCTGTGQVAPAG